MSLLHICIFNLEWYVSAMSLLHKLGLMLLLYFIYWYNWDIIGVVGQGGVSTFNFIQSLSEIRQLFIQSSQVIKSDISSGIRWEPMWVKYSKHLASKHLDQPGVGDHNYSQCGAERLPVWPQVVLVLKRICFEGSHHPNPHLHFHIPPPYQLPIINDFTIFRYLDLWSFSHILNV